MHCDKIYDLNNSYIWKHKSSDHFENSMGWLTFSNNGPVVFEVHHVYTCKLTVDQWKVNILKKLLWTEFLTDFQNIGIKIFRKARRLIKKYSKNFRRGLRGPKMTKNDKNMKIG